MKHMFFSAIVGILMTVGLQWAWFDVIGWGGIQYVKGQGGSAFGWYASLFTPPIVFVLLASSIVYLVSAILIQKRRHGEA